MNHHRGASARPARSASSRLFFVSNNNVCYDNGSSVTLMPLFLNINAVLKYYSRNIAVSLLIFELNIISSSRHPSMVASFMMQSHCGQILPVAMPILRLCVRITTFFFFFFSVILFQVTVTRSESSPSLDVMVFKR